MTAGRGAATATPARLSAADARQLTARIRDALVVADELLLQAWRGRAWEALGYPAGAAGWAAYCAAELPELQTLRLRPPALRAKVQGLAREGLSIGAIQGLTGAGRATIHGHIATMPDRPAYSTALDGRVRSARTATPVAPRVSPSPAVQPTQPIVVQLVALVREHGPLSCAAIKAQTGWDHGRASAALHRLAAAGRLVYTPPARRGLHGTYSIGD